MDVFLGWIGGHFWTAVFPALVAVFAAQVYWLALGLPWWRKAIIFALQFALIALMAAAAWNVPVVPDSPAAPAPSYEMACDVLTVYGPVGTVAQREPRVLVAPETPWSRKGSVTLERGCVLEIYPAGQPVSQEWR